MIRFHSASILFMFFAVSCEQESKQSNDQPPEQMQPADETVVMDTYFDTQVADPYRWLEDWSNPEVQAWSDEQTAQAKACLSALPVRQSLVTEFQTMFSGADKGSFSNFTFRENMIFAWRRQKGEARPKLVKSTWPGDLQTADILFDLLEEDETGETSFNWYVPSNSGRYVAIALSQGGSERAYLRIIDAQTGEKIGTDIPNVHNATAGGDLVWRADESGFVYTRYPLPGEENEDYPNMFLKAYDHDLNAPDWKNDPLALGADFDKVAQIRLQSYDGGLSAWVQDGDSGRFAYYRRDYDAAEEGFIKQAKFEDGHFQFIEGDNGELFILSTSNNAPKGRILRSSSGAAIAEAVEIVPPFDSGSLSHSYYSHSSPTALWANGHLFVRYNTGGPSEIRVFDREGNAVDIGFSLPLMTVSQMTGVDDGLLFSAEGYAAPAQWFEIDLAEKSITPNTTFSPDASGGWDDIRVERMFATSKDGTQIPLNVLLPPNFDPEAGPVRALVTGYGGFRGSVTPRFHSDYRALLERGFLIAEVNLRGGAEFGEEWHQGGYLTNKQNVFDDFIAAVTHLQALEWTAPEQTAIIGSSNGGLLIGAVVVQAPDISAVAVAKVGLFDMLRVELDPNGVYNIPEYGTVKNEEQFRALYAYSPYHNVKDETAYPAMLLTTGANDQRVNPMHSRKMTARLLEANTGTKPILLRAERTGGHGHGASIEARVFDLADVYSFILTYSSGEEAPSTCQ